VAFFILTETPHHRVPERKLNINPLVPLARAARDRKLRPLYFTWSFFAFAFVTSQSVFSLFVRDVFGFSAYQTGLTFTMIGLVTVFNQAFLLKKFWLARFSESALEVIMLVILSIGLFGILAERLPLFFISLLFLGTGQAVLRVVITSQATAATDPRRKGETMGILAALMSSYMFSAPLISGYLFEMNHAFPYALSAGLVLLGVFFALRFRRQAAVAAAD